MGTKSEQFKKLYRITNNKTGEVFEARGQQSVMLLAGLDPHTAKTVLEKSQKWTIEILEGPAEWDEQTYRKQLYQDTKSKYPGYEIKKRLRNPLYEKTKRLRVRGYRNLDGSVFTAEQHEVMICNSCEVCGTTDSVVDHCHATGVVRGSLCRHCNSALGFAKDSVDTLYGLIEYLKKAQKRINERHCDAKNQN